MLKQLKKYISFQNNFSEKMLIVTDKLLIQIYTLLLELEPIGFFWRAFLGISRSGIHFKTLTFNAFPERFFPSVGKWKMPFDF